MKQLLTALAITLFTVSAVAAQYCQTRCYYDPWTKQQVCQTFCY